jgi:hypothetical protein
MRPFQGTPKFHLLTRWHLMEKCSSCWTSFLSSELRFRAQSPPLFSASTRSILMRDCNCLSSTLIFHAVSNKVLFIFNSLNIIICLDYRLTIWIYCIHQKILFDLYGKWNNLSKTSSLKTQILFINWPSMKRARAFKVQNIIFLVITGF